MTSYGNLCLGNDNNASDPSNLRSANCRVVLEWRAINQQDEVAAVVALVDETTGEIVRSTSTNPFAVYEAGSSGRTEYLLKDSIPFFVGFMSPYRASRPTRFSATCKYEWDDVVTGTKPIVKYRDVPVQVEKQRVVTTYKEVSAFGCAVPR